MEPVTIWDRIRSALGLADDFDNATSKALVEALLLAFEDLNHRFSLARPFEALDRLDKSEREIAELIAELIACLFGLPEGARTDRVIVGLAAIVRELREARTQAAQLRLDLEALKAEGERRSALDAERFRVRFQIANDAVAAERDRADKAEAEARSLRASLNDVRRVFSANGIEVERYADDRADLERHLRAVVGAATALESSRRAGILIDAVDELDELNTVVELATVKLDALDREVEG